MTNYGGNRQALLGVQAIASYLPSGRVDNLEQADRFATDRDFVQQKIGAISLPRFEKEDTVVSACVAAFNKLCERENIDVTEIDCVVLCTQNPDGGGLPHNSALIHAELNLSEDCACFDIGLGCSGYVYGLSVIQAFMTANGMKKGLFFTCDPYSRILNQEDKNTCLLFGDAATVTLVTDTPKYMQLATKFSTKGKAGQALKKKNEQLEMNGRAVFNFALQDVPKQIKQTLNELDLTVDEVDLFLLHQGSRYMLENAVQRTGIPSGKAPIKLSETGNTVSSSIPLLWEAAFKDKPKIILISGFGVGLSWATAVFKMVN